MSRHFRWRARLALGALVTVCASAFVQETAIAPAGAATLRFSASDDASVAKASPDANFGGSSTLTADGSPVVESVLRFQVSGTGGSVSRAKLRLRVTNASSDGPAVYPAATGWAEGTVTWTSRPARTGPAVADLGSVKKDAWVEVDVTAAVRGDGVHAFTLASSASDATDFASSEASSKRRPQLVIETGGTPPPPPPPPPPSPPPPNADPRQAPLAPASGAHFGMHLKLDNNLSIEGRKDYIRDWETALGRTLAIDHYYEPWGDVFPTWREPFDFAEGRIPMISWARVKTTDVTAGLHDAYIRARADGVKSLGRQVFLRWFWEMDGSRNAGLSISPADYIAAWKHIRALFAERGVTNAVWVWCPNASAFKTGEAQLYYPGDAHVDWVCADGYNWYPGAAGRAYESFEQKFVAFHDWAVSRNKPAMAGEYGAMKMEPDRRAGWFNAARESMKTRLPGMLAVVYFHSIVEHDWTLTNELDAFEAFKQMGLDPYFNP